MDEQKLTKEQVIDLFAQILSGIDSLPCREVEVMALQDLALSALTPARDEGLEPAAWIEHHKGGDNLVWTESRLPCTPLYRALSQRPGEQNAKETQK